MRPNFFFIFRLLTFIGLIGCATGPAAAQFPAPRFVDGFTDFPLTDDTFVYYVAADGDDRNTGLSPNKPLRTAAAGYGKLRDDAADRLLFKAGDTFVGNLGALDKSGLGPTEPMVLGVYGEGPRPVLLSPRNTWAHKGFDDRVDFVAFQGLHFVAMHRRQAADTGDAASLTPERWNQSALTLLGRSRFVLVEDCKFEAFKFPLVFQSSPEAGPARNITLRRNIVVDSFGHWDSKIAGHSSGLFAKHIHHLTLEENLWDHNGWTPRVGGAGRTKFNHNIYVQTDCKDVAVRREIVTRGSAHGLQLRPGGVIENCLFVQNPLAFFVGLHESVVRDNVVLQAVDMGSKPDQRRGRGIDVLPCLNVLVENNVVSQKTSSALSAAAIHVGWEKNNIEWLAGRPFRVSVTGNKVYNWPYRMPNPQEAYDPQAHQRLSIKINKTATLERFEDNHADDPRWPDPSRDVARYMAHLGQDASLQALSLIHI